MSISHILIALLGIIQWTSATDQGGDAIFCTSFDACRNDGYKVWNILQTTLTDPQAKDKTEGNKIFPQSYVVQPSEIQFSYVGLERDLTEHGFNVTELSDWETTSINPITHEPDDPAAYDNSFDTKRGLIVAHWNYNIADHQRRLPWSEIIYQTWKFAQQMTDGGSISNLRAVIRHQAANPGTLTTLRILFKNRKLRPNAGDGTWYEWNETEHDVFFFALVGTDNVKGILWLLNDHSAEIGKKEVTRVWVRWPGLFPDIWIDIAPASPKLRLLTDSKLSARRKTR